MVNCCTLAQLFNSQQDVEKEMQRIKPKHIFTSAFWLPYTNGRQFDIEKLEKVKKQLQNKKG